MLSKALLGLTLYVTEDLFYAKHCAEYQGPLLKVLN